jgi:hypothetical protein
VGVTVTVWVKALIVASVWPVTVVVVVTGGDPLVAEDDPVRSTV